MKIIVKKPNKPLEVREVEELTLELMQQIVGGYIEVLNIGNQMLIVMDEEGKLKQSEFNFTAGKHVIVGTIFFCSEDGVEMVGLNDAQINIIQKTFM